jgi:nitrate reductase gamma subunit
MDLLLFVVLPYFALGVFVAGTVERLWRHRYSVTSQSSQILERRLHGWGMAPFHAGIAGVLLFHLLAVVAPRSVAAWNGEPSRLFALEVALLAFGLLATAGLALLVLRRVTDAKLRAVTPRGDAVVYALLLTQLATGVLVALSQRWGAGWFLAVATPYLRSLLRLGPDTAAMAAMPLVVRVHVASAFVLLAVFPFSRLVHVLMAPAPYFWRRPQVVRWYRRRPVPHGG